MIKDNQKIFNRLHVLIDAIIVACSYMLAWFIHFESVFSAYFVEPGEGYLDMERYFEAMWLLVPGYLILYYSFNMLFYSVEKSFQKFYKNLITLNN